jgi:hypothetical protein
MLVQWFDVPEEVEPAEEESNKLQSVIPPRRFNRKPNSS